MAVDPNLQRLEDTVAALGPLTEELCLVGGCSVALLITDEGASPVRATLDVDVIVEAIQYTDYITFCSQLTQRGFVQDPGSLDSICRWKQGELMIDIMPLYEEVLGFSNRWYKHAFKHRCSLTLPNGAEIYHVDAPHFLGTKLAAFENRGRGDYAESYDLEDLIRVIDGRSSIVNEVAASTADLRTHIASGIEALLSDRFFVEALPTYFDDGDLRAPIVFQRLKALASQTP